MMTDQEKQAMSQAAAQIEELTRQLQLKANEKAVRTLLQEINDKFIGSLTGLVKQVIDLSASLKEIAAQNKIAKDDLLDGISNVKIEPVVNVKIPDIKVPEATVNVKIPEIKLPTINVPKPEVTVNPPAVHFPEYPKEMAVIGFSGLVKSILDALKGIFRVDVQQSRDKPLNVILCDDKGNQYKAIGGGVMVGGSSGPGSSAAHRSMQAAIEMLTLTAQNTVYPYTVPDGTQRIDFRLVSGDYSLQYSYDNFTNYFPLSAGSVKTIADVNLEGKTLYFKCTEAAGEIVAIEILKR